MMIDVKWIIENPQKILEGARKKRVHVEVELILEFYNKRNQKLQEKEQLRSRQNDFSQKINQTPESGKAALLAEMKKIKTEIQALDPQISELEQKIDELVVLVPNPILESVPEGDDENSNVVIKTHGERPQFKFSPRDHIEIGKKLDIIDIERGARTSGTRFYYLKNDAVFLEFALVQYVLEKLRSRGFKAVIPPVLVKEEAMFVTGFFPKDRSEIYHVNPNEDNLFLVGTSEVPLTMLHHEEILDEKELPIRYTAFSTCFRREAGSYGKDTAGIIRVHQFDKIEMFSFCHPAKSEEEHEFIKSIEEEIMQELGLHYQVLNICSGDLGTPAAKKYDIEAWIPTQEKFRELTSCSNCTDFQARRAKIKYRDGNGKNEYLHTLNGTAIAIARTLVAILENYQNEDGSVTIPEVLKPYIHHDKIETI